MVLRTFGGGFIFMIQSKKCRNCLIDKPINEFHKHNIRPDGLNYICKSCNIDKSRKYKKTKDGLISQIYGGQKRRSKKRNHHLPSYTMIELREWLYKQPLFHNLYDNWVNSNYNIKLVPSLDRKCNKKGYTFENIRLVTWEINDDNANKDVVNGIDTRTTKSVSQFTKDNKFIKHYHSISHASRVTSVSRTGISKCCLLKQNQSGGFIWSY